MKTAVLSLFLGALITDAGAGDRFRVYFGCYTNAQSGSKGIMVSEFNSADGTMGTPVLAIEAGNPSFLALHPDGKHLYSVGEMAMPGATGGAVTAYSINPGDGTLKKLNAVDSVGAGPCHIALDQTGRMAMVANYSGGSIASFRIEEDGTLSKAVSFSQHTGSGVNPQRQKEPHAHSVNRSPDNRFAFACDLGLDKVFTCRIDPVAGSLKEIGSVALPPGSGPRHFAFHPNGKFAFVNNEMLMTVSSFAYEEDSGLLALQETVSTLPEADRDKKGYSTAETVVHPDGKTVYVSNRTHDTIAVFRCDPETGKLTLIQNAPAEGQVPRNFCLDPSGRWMIVAHQNSGTAAVLKVDPDTGKLSFTGNKVPVGGAVCVRFLAID